MNQLPLIVFELIITAWLIIWKGIALWKSAGYKQKNWFIGILILGGLTFGILEIVYLFFFAKKKLTLGELKFWDNK